MAHLVGLEQLRGADGVLRLYRPLRTHYDRRGDRSEYMRDHERRRWDAALAARLTGGGLAREQALAAWLVPSRAARAADIDSARPTNVL